MAHSVTVICSLYFHLQVWHLMVTIPQQFGIPFSVDPQREPGNSKKESWLRTRSGMRFVRYWIYLSDLYVVICGEFNFPETNVIVNGISNQQISSRGIIVQGRMDDDENIYFKAPSSTGWWFQPLWKILVSQFGWLFPTYGNIKHVPNHQPEYVYLDGFTKQQMEVSINGYLPNHPNFNMIFHNMNHSFLGVPILETP